MASWCVIGRMAIIVEEPGVNRLGEVVDALRQWQHDEAPMQLHPGDLGWYWQFGAEATAAAVRTWRRDGQIVAIGLLDQPNLLRLTTAPDDEKSDEKSDELAQQLVADLSDPHRGALPAGAVAVEAPNGTLVQHRLSESGWRIDEAWTPLRRDLTEPVEDPGVRIEAIGPERAHVLTAVHRASFGSAKFTDERWQSMAGGVPFADARCLVAFDDQGAAVATVTVWSAGPGRPGLLEPLEVHAEHRFQGYGTAISVAAAETLQQLGASSALVCTPSSNVGAVATYLSAGYQKLPERRDRARA